jgi:hypothetical protein
LDVQVSYSSLNEEALESSPNSMLSVPLIYSAKKTNSRGVERYRNLGIEHVGNRQISSNDMPGSSDESSQHIEDTGSESDSGPSSIIEESKSDRDREQSPAGYDQAGQHLENGDNPFIPPNISDLELDLVVSGVLTRCCLSDI